MSTNEAELRDELRAIGCPYELEDHRMPIWFDGYRAAVRQSVETASARFEPTTKQPGDIVIGGSKIEVHP